MAKPYVLMAAMALNARDGVDLRLQQAGIETVVGSFHKGRTEEETIGFLRGIDGAMAGNYPFTARVQGGRPG